MTEALNRTASQSELPAVATLAKRETVPLDYSKIPEVKLRRITGERVGSGNTLQPFHVYVNRRGDLWQLIDISTT